MSVAIIANFKPQFTIFARTHIADKSIVCIISAFTFMQHNIRYRYCFPSSSVQVGDAVTIQIDILLLTHLRIHIAIAILHIATNHQSNTQSRKYMHPHLSPPLPLSQQSTVTSPFHVPFSSNGCAKSSLGSPNHTANSFRYFCTRIAQSSNISTPMTSAGFPACQSYVSEKFQSPTILYTQQSVDENSALILRLKPPIA